MQTGSEATAHLLGQRGNCRAVSVVFAPTCLRKLTRGAVHVVSLDREKARHCVDGAPARRSKGYVRPRPAVPTIPEVLMSQLKYRAYPLLITAITVLAATGGAFRTN